MMTAARAASRLHYNKKRTTTPTKNPVQKRCSSSTNVLEHSNSPRNSLSVPDANPLLRKRSGSVPAIKMDTLATEMNLKPSHVRALKLTWARLCEPPRSHCKGIVALTERVWTKLDTKDPSVREIFYRAAFVDGMQERCERRRSANSIATLRDHTHFFVSLVSQVVQSLDNDPADMFAHLDKIGRNHAYLKQYGFRSAHWEKVGEYFLDTIVIQDCVRGYPEACRSWTLLIAAMVDRLRAAPRRGSVAAVAEKDESSSHVLPVRICSGNVVCPISRTPRGSMADIYAGSRRGSNGEIKMDNDRRGSGGELKVELQPRRASFSDLRAIEAAKQANDPAANFAATVMNLIPGRKLGATIEMAAAASCPLSSMGKMKDSLPETKSTPSAKA